MANWMMLKTSRKMIGPAMLPAMAIWEVMPARMGTRVIQKRASPMPPSGPMRETRTARMVGMSALFCSRDRQMPMAKVTRNGWMLKNSMLWVMEVARSSLSVWIFSRPGRMEYSQPAACMRS